MPRACPASPVPQGTGVPPRLKRLEDGGVVNATVDPGGHFVWSLPAGTYVIDRINYRDPMTGNYFVVPKFAFKVAEAGAAYYTGTMRIDAVTSRDFLGGLDGRVKYSVHDEYAKQRTYLRQRFGEDVGTFRKALMIHEPRLPTSVENTPEFQVAITLLGAL